MGRTGKMFALDHHEDRTHRCAPGCWRGEHSAARGCRQRGHALGHGGERPCMLPGRRPGDGVRAGERA
jgi:hypothetical protein